MARIRTIKPTIWQSEQLGDVTVEARLLFVGLVTQADDEGRMKGSPKLVKSWVFPYDDFTSEDVAEWLRELSGARLIHWYEVDEQQFIELPTWGKHQRVSHASESQYPSHSEADSEDFQNLPEGSRESAPGIRKGREGNKEGKELSRAHAREATDQENEAAREIIATFAHHAQQRFTTEAWADRVIACLKAHPDLETGDHLAIIAAAFRNPWWEGPPTPAVLYGSVGQFERQLAEWRSPKSGRKRKSGKLSPGERDQQAKEQRQRDEAWAREHFPTEPLADVLGIITRVQLAKKPVEVGIVGEWLQAKRVTAESRVAA